MARRLKFNLLEGTMLRWSTRIVNRVMQALGILEPSHVTHIAAHRVAKQIIPIRVTSGNVYHELHSRPTGYYLEQRKASSSHANQPHKSCSEVFAKDPNREKGTCINDDDASRIQRSSLEVEGLTHCKLVCSTSATRRLPSIAALSFGIPLDPKVHASDSQPP